MLLLTRVDAGDSRVGNWWAGNAAAQRTVDCVGSTRAVAARARRPGLPQGVLCFDNGCQLNVFGC